MVTKKITIEPVTRIEGHAKVTVHMNEDGSVNHAYFHVNEFRGFEKFCEGRLVEEMQQITPRICGICPVSHHLAAAKAGDAALGCPPPKPASLLREVMHMGQIIQSHGMHFFELGGPDLLLGFDHDPATRNVVGLIHANPELTLKAVNLRKFGQNVIAELGERPIHPNFAVPGGVIRPINQNGRDRLKRQIPEQIQTIQLAIQIFKQWMEANMEDINKFAVFPTGYFGLVTPQNSLELYDGQIKLTGKDGKQLVKFDPANYLDQIAEHVEPWSYLKFPYYKPLSFPGGVYRVGPLGRCNTAEQIDTPLANEELKLFKAMQGGKMIENTLHYHYARLIETLFAAERLAVLLDDPDILGKDILNTRRNPQERGVGCIEAPRGTLIHDYYTNEHGQLTKVNLIVSTGHNNYAMSQAVDEVAKTYVHGPEVKEGMLNRVEHAIRAHDPCLSCSTHAIGQMPLVIDILDASGKLTQTLKRH
ncbi:MAG: Ni/Fe hydrogenase subunit alpha [Anaerolineaceae bacterium]|nr:Ni/Fe hydrogenase subunit alpha [Anaerolineaceae bacterium]